jgi:hypothetical protein
MTNIDQLLNMSADDFKEPPKLPAALYRMKIDDAKIVPFQWRAKADKPERRGLGVAFVCSPVDCLDAEGDSDEAKAIQAALSEYGDWKGRQFSGTYTSKDNPPKEMLGVSPTSFALQMEDGSPAPGAFNFYQHDKDNYDGFVPNVLGLEFPANTTLGDIIPACVGKEFLAQIGYTADQEGKPRPFPEITDVAMAP